MSTSFMADISNFQDDEFDDSTSFLSADIPLKSTPLRSGVPQDTHSQLALH